MRKTILEADEIYRGWLKNPQKKGLVILLCGSIDRLPVPQRQEIAYEALRSLQSAECKPRLSTSQDPIIQQYLNQQ